MINLETIGADPEVILVDDAGFPVSSLGIIPGTKHRPVDISLESGTYGVQKDNVLAEYTIPPAKTSKEFSEHIKIGLGIIEEIAGAQGFRASIDCTGFYDKKYLRHNLARTFGCDEDFCAWTGNTNEAPKVPLEGFRSAGGHIHLGLNVVEPSINQNLVKCLDLFVGIPSLLADGDRERRRLYGKAGSYRNKPYGLEYRTLSNFWIFNEGFIHNIYRNVVEAIDFFNRTMIPEDLEKVIENAINNYSIDVAEDMCKEYNIPLFEQNENQFCSTKIKTV